MEAPLSGVTELRHLGRVATGFAHLYLYSIGLSALHTTSRSVTLLHKCLTVVLKSLSVFLLCIFDFAELRGESFEFCSRIYIYVFVPARGSLHPGPSLQLRRRMPQIP